MSWLSKPYYRIVRDNYNGYEVQHWRWWFPVWVQPEINTHKSLESAKNWAVEYEAKRKEICYLGQL